MVVAIVILVLASIYGFMQGGENVGYAICALLVAVVLLIIKITKSSVPKASVQSPSSSPECVSTPPSNVPVEPERPVSEPDFFEDEAIQRGKNLIPDGLLTDTDGIPFPFEGILSPFDPLGLERIDNDYYELISPQNIQKARSVILSLNACLDEAAAQRDDLPPQRFISNQLKFKFDPYAGTHDYCMVSYKHRIPPSAPEYYECSLHISYTDILFGNVVFDQFGAFKNAELISWHKTCTAYPDRIEMGGTCFHIQVAADSSGTPILLSAKTHAEIEVERQRKSRAWQEVHDKWEPITAKHQQLTETIGVAYTVASNQETFDNPQMQHVIDLCLEDITLAEPFIESLKEIQKVRETNGWSKEKDVTMRLPNYPSFKRLAIIYEKQKRYDDAIAICQHAIELGFVSDGTSGQMPGRIARLQRKKSKAESN